MDDNDDDRPNSPNLPLGVRVEDIAIRAKRESKLLSGIGRGRWVIIVSGATTISLLLRLQAFESGAHLDRLWSHILQDQHPSIFWSEMCGIIHSKPLWPLLVVLPERKWLSARLQLLLRGVERADRYRRWNLEDAADMSIFEWYTGMIEEMQDKIRLIQQQLALLVLF